MTQTPPSHSVDDGQRPDNQDTEMPDADSPRGLADRRTDISGRVHHPAHTAVIAATAISEKFAATFWGKPEVKASCAPPPPPHRILRMPDPAQNPTDEYSDTTQPVGNAEVDPSFKDDEAACRVLAEEMRQRIEQLESDLANAPSPDSVRALERSLQAESAQRERLQQELRQKHSELDVLRKHWKQAALELDKARSQSQGFYQVTDNYLIELTTRLRYNIKNFAFQYFDGEMKGQRPRFDKPKIWDKYMQTITPDPLDCEVLMLSERRPSAVQAFIWRFLVGDVFDRFRWAGELGVTLRRMCLELRPGQYQDSMCPIVPDEERKFQMWLASTTAMVLDAGSAPNKSRVFTEKVHRNNDTLTRKMRGVLDHYLVVDDPAYPLELARIVEEAVKFDTEISRQVARVEWVFPAAGNEILFDPEIMRLGTGEMGAKEKQKQLVQLVVCPAMRKRGKSTGDDFGLPSTLLVPMEVSCEAVKRNEASARKATA
ncbi:hypothetical protein AN7371.2 [Aspergillus nidulans FGSC A4]|uniref:Uncharacterized protein n=1 Tax=Emericella nidulans (strain FGSC A4 / ATCC 38163 / CBS 112.46 / NRRL 194 / M139) TaxID=227321 RepID=Q5AWF9_EMENI|nr:hypothetical protein [Aspergillus nidulans FGSC A4]EAA61742.1 hypothetical protein AN7371.2 [Aspergillus nidulans FGSC A4]CBF78519.1 TPA: conserved hypothetical protein [Aspergillus nidulans FGSC A4]|eukprot:XP_680640.1 hypothetical protein AN7371.2 [Aspergillus nidulans FGSC A4]